MMAGLQTHWRNFNSKHCATIHRTNVRVVNAFNAYISIGHVRLRIRLTTNFSIEHFYIYASDETIHGAVERFGYKKAGSASSGQQMLDVKREERTRLDRSSSDDIPFSARCRTSGSSPDDQRGSPSLHRAISARPDVRVNNETVTEARGRSYASAYWLVLLRFSKETASVYRSLP